LLYDAQQKTFERVERHVVAVVERRLVLEGPASEQHHTSGDRRVQLPAGGRSARAAAEPDAAEKVVDALLLDETDVVG